MGPTKNIKQILHVDGKGRELDVLQKCYVYRDTKKDNRINDCITHGRREWVRVHVKKFFWPQSKTGPARRKVRKQSRECRRIDDRRA